MAFSLHRSDWNDLWHWLLVKTYKNVSVCLFICLFVRVFRPTREFFTHMETSFLPIKGCKVWPTVCSALMAIEQRGFFSMPHLLWHWGTVHEVSVTLMSSEAVTTCFHDLILSLIEFENPILPPSGQTLWLTDPPPRPKNKKKPNMTGRKCNVFQL